MMYWYDNYEYGRLMVMAMGLFLAAGRVEVWLGGHVMVDRMGLGQEVGEVVGTGTPYHSEVAHGNTIAEPMVAHGDGFGSLEAAGVVGDLAGDGVVEDDLRRVELWVADVQGGLT